jgi:hypothetical protein
MSGAARTSVFCHENSVPNPPRAMRKKNSPGDLPRQIRKTEKYAAEARSATAGMMKVSAR